MYPHHIQFCTHNMSNVYCPCVCTSYTSHQHKTCCCCCRSTDSELKCWQTQHGTCLRTYRGHVNDTNCVGLTVTPDFIACGEFAKTKRNGMKLESFFDSYCITFASTISTSTLLLLVHKRYLLCEMAYSVCLQEARTMQYMCMLSRSAALC